MTETFASNAAVQVGLVALPALRPALQAAGIRVTTNDVFQVAARAITEALKEQSFPVVVSNKGPSALLRTWTRSVARDASVVVVIALEDGYTEFPEGVAVLHAPVAANEILAAAGIDPMENLSGFVVNSLGDIENESPSAATTGFDAFDDLEEVDDINDDSQPPVPQIPAIPDMPVTDGSQFEDFGPTIPSVPDVPTMPSVFDQADFEEFESQAPVAPEPPVYTPVEPIRVPEPVTEPEPELATEDEPEEDVPAPFVSESPVPASVRAQAAITPKDWVYQIDQYADTTSPPPEAIVGAWWSDENGLVDPNSFQPNPHYVPGTPPAEPRPAPFGGFDNTDVVANPPVVFAEPLPEPVLDEPLTEEIIAVSVPTTPPLTFDELPAPEDELPDSYQPSHQAPTPPPIPVAPEPEPQPEPTYVPEVRQPAHVEPTPVVEAPRPASVAPPVVIAPVVAPIVPPVVTPRPQAPSDLIAPASGRQPLGDYVEPTTLTSGDNPLSMGRNDDSYQSVRNRPHGKGDVVISWSGKGGVGKSTMAYSLAQRAAKQGKKVVLIDGNFGQGDLRQYLRLTKANIPSIYDAAKSRNLKDAFIGPDVINQFRSEALDDIKFVYVAAPPPHLADTSVVTPELYAAIIAEATHFADLIFLDTQIIETVDSTGMVDRLVTPLLVDRAWGVGVSDLSAPGIANTMRRLDSFAEDGVPSTRQMTMLNRVPVTGGFNAEKLAAALSKNSWFVGAVQNDDSIYNQMNIGRTVSDNEGLAPMLDAILARIAGQQPPQVVLASAPPTKTKRKLFGRNKS